MFSLRYEKAEKIGGTSGRDWKTAPWNRTLVNIFNNKYKKSFHFYNLVGNGCLVTVFSIRCSRLFYVFFLSPNPLFQKKFNPLSTVNNKKQPKIKKNLLMSTKIWKNLFFYWDSFFYSPNQKNNKQTQQTNTTNKHNKQKKLQVVTVFSENMKLATYIHAYTHRCPLFFSLSLF